MPAEVANVAELGSGVESDTLICIKRDRGTVSLPCGQVPRSHGKEAPRLV